MLLESWDGFTALARLKEFVMHGLCCPRQAVCVTAVCPRQAVYVTASHAAVGCVMLQYADIAVNTAVGRSLDCILLAIGF